MALGSQGKASTGPGPDDIPQPVERGIELRSVLDLRPYPGNARRHSKRQIRQIAQSIRRFGFTNPVLIGEDGEIIAGHGRVEAAKLLGIPKVPTLALSHLDATARRAYVLADNKLALNAGWDAATLATELQGLIDLEFDVELTGFSLAEIDLVIDTAAERQTATVDADTDDHMPPATPHPVTQPGDVWALGRHRLICGDAREKDIYTTLLGEEQVDLIFTDPPYNVRIDGHVCGLGTIRHREFAHASGEMDRQAFTAFLTASLSAMARHCRNGAIAFVCMDWRHMR